MGLFIAIDGPDGGGKSTLYDTWCQKDISLQPLHDVAPLFPVANGPGYLLACQQHAQGFLRRALCRRHVLTTRYAFYALPARHFAEFGRHIPPPQGLAAPDIVVYATARYDVLRKRLEERTEQRGVQSLDDRRLRRMCVWYDHMFCDNPTVVRVNTETTTPLQALDALVHYMSAHHTIKVRSLLNTVRGYIAHTEGYE